MGTLLSIFTDFIDNIKSNNSSMYKNINQEIFYDKNVAYFNYDFMMSLDKKDYAKYLAIAYKEKTDKKLNLKNPKTLNEKIQWLKIYDNIPLKTELSDKIKVRDWIKAKIGEEYLKPILWIGDSFDDIPFDILPDSFVIKVNHGCKWQVIIKNKQAYIENKQVFEYSKIRIEHWLKQNFFGYSDFETQYLNIRPKLFIEPLMRDDINTVSKDYCVWCVNSVPYVEIENNKFKEEAMRLSKILAQDFKLVRVDWMIYNNNLYFGEMTFTPLSGFIPDIMLEQSFYQELSKNFTLK